MTNHVPTLKGINRTFLKLHNLNFKILIILGLGETFYLLAKENVRTSTDNKYFEHIENSIKVKF